MLPVPSIRAVIFDRDGTLNRSVNVTSHGYALTPDDITLLPGAREALALLRAAGVTPLVFTQQSCVGKGLLTEEGLAAIHQRIQELLGPAARVEAFHHCPHVAEDACGCRKPQPGLLTAILETCGLSAEEVLVVGDTERDYLAARRAGLRFYYVRGPRTPANPEAPVVENLLAFVRAVGL